MESRRPQDPLHTGTADLLSRARAGEAAAFGQLLERHLPRLTTYVRLRLSPALAARLDLADVVQETCLEAFRSLASFEPRGPGSFARWLCAVAENRLRDGAEREGARKRRPPGEAEELGQVLERARLSATGPATAADRGERHERLARTLEALPEEQRRALLLRYFSGWSAARIARELGTSESGARRLVARATAAVGSELSEEGA